jgi:hypothetical protein
VVGKFEWFIEAVGFEGVGDVGVNRDISSIPLHGCFYKILLSETPHIKSKTSY